MASAAVELMAQEYVLIEVLCCYRSPLSFALVCDQSDPSRSEIECLLCFFRLRSDFFEGPSLGFLPSRPFLDSEVLRNPRFNEQRIPLRAFCVIIRVNKAFQLV